LLSKENGMAPPGAFTSAAESDVAVVLAGAASTSFTAVRRAAWEAGGVAVTARPGALFCGTGFAAIAAGAADPNGIGAAPVDAAVPEVVARGACFAAGLRLVAARFCAGMWSCTGM
jgi:hypothetical protein